MSLWVWQISEASWNNNSFAFWLSPLQWKCSVLITALPGKFQYLFFLIGPLFPVPSCPIIDILEN